MMDREYINGKLYAIGTDVFNMKNLLEPSDPNYAINHHDLREQAAIILSASLLSDSNLKKFLLTNIVTTANELDSYGLFSLADHIMPRLDGFFFRKNYDYDEGWHDLLDKFREGKIRGIKEWIELKNKSKKHVKKKSHHVISRGYVGDYGYILPQHPQNGADLGSDVIQDLNSEIVKIFADESQQEVYAQRLIQKYESLIAKSKKSNNYIAPIDSYCDSKSTREYWMMAKQNEPSSALKDFLDYIKQVSCEAKPAPGSSKERGKR